MSETAFATFMGSTLSSLAKLLKAPEGTFLFSAVGPQSGHRLGEVSIDGEVFSISLNSPEDADDLVLREAVEVVGKYLASEAPRLRLDGDCPGFFSAGGTRWHTADTLAEYLSIVISKRFFARIENATGIHLPYVSLLAEMFYESDESVGTLAFLDGDFPTAVLNQIVQPILAPETPVTLERKHLGSIRKRFAGVGDGGLLFIREDGKYVLHGYVRKKYIPQIPVSVEIQGRENWCLQFRGKCIFGAKASQVYCLKSMLKFNIDRLKEELGEAEIVALEPAIRAISNQKHGTSIVLLDLEQDIARERMEALARHGRAQRVHGLRIIGLPAGEDKEAVFALLKNLARVDGALVIDYPRGEVAYVEAILDGDSIVPGDAAAGARRNVVSCFIANLALRKAPARVKELKAAALMFSESGEILLARASDYRTKGNQAVLRKKHRAVCQKDCRLAAAKRNIRRNMRENNR